MQTGAYSHTGYKAPPCDHRAWGYAATPTSRPRDAGKEMAASTQVPGSAIRYERGSLQRPRGRPSQTRTAGGFLEGWSHGGWTKSARHKKEGVRASYMWGRVYDSREGYEF